MIQITLSSFLDRFPEFTAITTQYSSLFQTVFDDTVTEVNGYDYLSRNPSVQSLALSLHIAFNLQSRSREISMALGGSASSIGALIVKEDSYLEGSSTYDVSARNQLLAKSRNSDYWERLQNLLKTNSYASVGMLGFGISPFN
jgi:hypothetical protein